MNHESRAVGGSVCQSGFPCSPLVVADSDPGPRCSTSPTPWSLSPPTLTKPEQNAVALLVDDVAQEVWHPLEGASSTGPAKGRPVVAVGPAVSVRGLCRTVREERSRTIEPQAWPKATAFARRPTARRSWWPATMHEACSSASAGCSASCGQLRIACSCPRASSLTPARTYPLRGHQLGYRPKTNSYDGWDLPQWERYIRDLAIFGTNAVELIPPRSDDDSESPHFPRPPLEMMVGMSSQMGTRITGDPRDVALREALYSALLASSGAAGKRLVSLCV